jgi:hypothetical protein
MAYFIFLKNADNLDSSLYKIAENQFDLDNLNIIKSDYKIIEDSQENFNAVKFGTKHPKYNGDVISFYPAQCSYNKDELQVNVNSYKDLIKQFTNNNSNHPLFSRWNSYHTQLNSLNFDNITYPLNKSLEQYFNDLGQTSLNPLQLP